MNTFDRNASPETPETGGPALMTDLSEALAGPDGAAIAAGIAARFAAADARLAAEAERGAAPARFASITAIRKGLSHATQVLRAAAPLGDETSRRD